jgi:O-antigen ligase
MKDIAKFVAYTGLFIIPFLVLNVQNEMFFPYITGKNFGFRIITEIIFAAWIVLACFDPQYRPKRSWIIGSFSVFLIVMFIANWFGESRNAAFWSNFERMEGYMALLHTWMYFVAAGALLNTEKLWNRFLITNIFVASIVSFVAFGQVAGFVEHRYAGFRADATLGNATYMAIYMLFTTFVTFFMVARVQSKGWRYALVALSLLFMFMIVQTATRGTTLALVLALFVTVMYIGYFSAHYRKFAVGVLAALVFIVAGFIAVRDSEFIQSNATLQRVANISLSEGNVRFKVWNMAIEGFKERPILGWGQSGFSTVFNKNYDPSIYFAESWYDRVHNIFFDWLIAGGIIGTLAYFAVYFSALHHLVIRPLRRDDTMFTVAERGVLLGLLVGYLFHNIFVFDNIVSYIYYGTVLALIHARVGLPIAAFAKKNISRTVTEQIVAPVVGVALVLTFYFMNVPGIRAAGDIIDAFRATTPDTILSAFDAALSRNSFGDQEIREQMTRRAQEIIFNQEVSLEKKEEIIAKVEAELLKQIEEKPGDARAHVFIASFYRSVSSVFAQSDGSKALTLLEKAAAELERARELSPKKQQIIFEQGLTELQRQNYAGAEEYFKDAYELDTSYAEAASFYAIGAIANNNAAKAEELLSTDDRKSSFYMNDLTIQVLYATKQYALLIELFDYRIEKNPADAQLRTNLAFVVNESGNRAGALEILKKAGEDIPEFKTQAEQFMAELAKQTLPTAP